MTATEISKRGRVLAHVCEDVSLQGCWKVTLWPWFWEKDASPLNCQVMLPVTKVEQWKALIPLQILQVHR